MANTKEYAKLWCLKNKDKLKGYCRKAYLKQQEERKEYARNYHLKHKEEIKEKAVVYYKKNRDKLIAYSKKYNKTHQEEKLDYQNKYKNEKRHTDVGYKILCNLRVRIWRVIKRNSKAARTLELLGCSSDELKLYLESKFKEGMTWDNYGTGHNNRGMEEWNIDHIIPCANFDFSKPEEQKECFHYTNLQPLWAGENYKKHATLIGVN